MNPKPIARTRAPEKRIIVYSIPEWAKMRGVSTATAKRLIAKGKLKVTQLSERRRGIRSDHDQEYLDSCEVQS
jgi:predicted site-specific integrase-resolvase